MSSKFACHPCRTAAFSIVIVIGLAAMGCSKTDSAQARGRDDAAKPVKIKGALDKATQTIYVSSIEPR